MTGKMRLTHGFEITKVDMQTHPFFTHKQQIPLLAHAIKEGDNLIPYMGRGSVVSRSQVGGLNYNVS